MPEEVRSTYQAARRSATLGAVAMGVVGALQLLVLATCLAAVLGDVGPSLVETPRGWTLLASIVTTLASTVLLGRFFWFFGRDRSPFGTRQSLRLLAAAGLYLARVGIDAIMPALASVELAEGALAITQQPGIDLKTVAVVVFLGCLAMVMRYGDALKEDSDSIA